MCRMFCTYIRPILEYNSAIWNPSLAKDIRKIESVQRYFTKRIPGLSCLPYSDRLRRLNIETLELRRLKFDLVMVYKIIYGLVHLSCVDFFDISLASVTRGSGLKLFVPDARLNVRKHFFAVRVVKVWNTLPQNAVNAISLLTFKSLLDKVNFDAFLTEW